MTGKVYDDPWNTLEAIEQIRGKDRLLKTAKQTGQDQDWELARRSRKFVSEQIRNLRADFLIDEQRNSVDDPKQIWRKYF